ncbi:MAG: chemotaxis protein CheW [Candidatus Methylomirabilota bacterium]|nr:purine-binding chemotaxis protein CheW [candidate division NC10 bacterium]PWB43508.1 MAG: chemotaxis protein CheW [candidate division NC10 bacterium]
MTDVAIKTGYANDTQQFLTFALGQEEYGVEILKIQEIKGFAAITPLPNAPTFLKGVLNLRGTIVPIIDLRKKFGLPEVELTKFTVIVVVQVQGKITGFIVDAVSDVLDVAGTDIQPAPDLHGQVDTTCINGLAKAGEKLVILVDIEKVLTTGEAARAIGATVEAALHN